jgi:hypothetical protein
MPLLRVLKRFCLDNEGRLGTIAHEIEWRKPLLELRDS